MQEAMSVKNILIFTSLPLQNYMEPTWKMLQMNSPKFTYGQKYQRIQWYLITRCIKEPWFSVEVSLENSIRPGP